MICRSYGARFRGLWGQGLTALAMGYHPYGIGERMAHLVPGPGGNGYRLSPLVPTPKASADGVRDWEANGSMGGAGGNGYGLSPLQDWGANGSMGRAGGNGYGLASLQALQGAHPKKPIRQNPKAQGTLEQPLLPYSPVGTIALCQGRKALVDSTLAEESRRDERKPPPLAVPTIHPAETYTNLPNSLPLSTGNRGRVLVVLQQRPRYRIPKPGRHHGSGQPVRPNWNTP